MRSALFDEPLEVDRERIWLRDLAEWVDTTGLKVQHPQLDGTGLVVRLRRVGAASRRVPGPARAHGTVRPLAACAAEGPS
ncbi:hypothetical protein [Ornithinimicrobium kibberense]|uniref:hypothetical protein n=1 Tax=Ornithinimicrobium kibberense TaxID=282060 RepID=UPI00360F57D9